MAHLLDRHCVALDRHCVAGINYELLALESIIINRTGLT
jgi:hypothetical protein